METLDFAVIALGVLAFALISRRVANAPLTPPMVFVVFGLAIGQHGFGVVTIDLDATVIRTLTELTLVLVLFTDAARINFKATSGSRALPALLLMVALPLTVVAGAAIAIPLFGQFGFFEAALLAAVLAPTDAALGQAVLTAKVVPVRIRQVLNIESGLNDGLILPVVLILAALATAGGVTAADKEFWVRFVALQFILGPLVGAAVGFFGGVIVDRAARARWMTTSYQGLSALGLALIAYALAGAVGGNGFIAAFIAGLVMGNTKQSVCSFLFEFAEAQGQLLTLVTFLIFGAVMVPLALDVATEEMVIYALLSLTVIRMVPVFIALAGLRMRAPSLVFIGWFGPRGLASILFALVVVEEDAVGAHDEFLAVVVITVVMSVFLHGLSAAPAARWYGRHAAAFRIAHPDCPENMEVDELPTRVARGMPQTTTVTD